MVVAFDNNVLCLLLHPEADIPNDPATNKPIERAQERMELLMAHLARQDARVVIPSPVLSEFLTYASTEYLDEISTNKNFSVGSFDQRAAIEAAVALRRAMKSGHGKKLGLIGNWQKIKVDRQIVAIAKVERVQILYTTDRDILALAADSGLEAVHVADLPLPPSKTPLLDAAEGGDAATASDEPVASEPKPPSEQSHGVATKKADPPAPVLPSSPQGAPTPQQPDSSPPAALPARSKQ